MTLPQITIDGRLTADPELRYTPGGKPVLEFRIAASDRKKDERGEWIDGDQLFIDVTVWNGAEDAADKLKRGTRAVVLGRLLSASWQTKEGEKRSKVVVGSATVSVPCETPRGTTSGAYTPQADPWGQPAAPVAATWGDPAAEPPF